MQKYIEINNDYPGLVFYQEESENGMVMTICELEGDLLSKGSIDITVDCADIVVIRGKIQAERNVTCLPNLAADNGISAGWTLFCTGSIHSCQGDIKAGRNIEVNGWIDSGGSVIAGEYIECAGIFANDGDIIAGMSIITENQIAATGIIDCKLRIFAGVNLDDDEYDNHILCKKLLNGTVCLGNLKEGAQWESHKCNHEEDE